MDYNHDETIPNGVDLEMEQARSLTVIEGIEASVGEVLQTNFLQRSLIQASSYSHHSDSTASSWAIPSILRQHGRAGGGGLSHVSKDELQQCLEPVLARLQQLDAEALLQLTRVESSGARLRDGVQIRPIHNEISPQNRDPCSVRYIHLQEVVDQYTIGIFVFPPHAKIPLHDHPGMCVLSRVLYGDLHRLSLDLPIPEKPHGVRSWLPWSHSWASTHHHWQQPATASSDGRRLVYKKKHAVDRLSAPDCTVLYPFEGNLHEFVAGPCGAAVLDVLLPPYDTDHLRDCTFYEIQDFDPMDGASNGCNPHATTEHGDPCWVVPTDQPEDFHCISGQYRGMGGSG